MRGRSFAEVIEEAGRGIAQLELAGQPAVPTGPSRDIEVGAADRPALLVAWLNELLFRAESDQWLGLEFEVLQVSDTHLKVRARGASLQESPSLVKAATLHGVRVEAVAGGVEADVVLDI